ncbi:hypothetical protein QOT17_014731 [Balamuthia mandrillaris]
MALSHGRLESQDMAYDEQPLSSVGRLPHLRKCLLGKAFMRNKPVVRFRELTAFALFHNLFMVLLHGYVAWTLSLARFREHASSCSEVFYDEAGTAIAQLLWLFLLAKALAAVGDSYIVIMWKEDHHKDIPHLFFHISDFTLWWIIVMYAPNGQAIPWTFLRSSIDSLLYFTYLLHILVPSSSSSSKRSFFRFLPDRLHQLCDWSHVLVLMLQLLHGLYLLRMCSRLDFNHMVFRNKWLGVILLLQVVMVLVVGVAFDHRGLRTSVLRWLRLRQQKQQQHQKNFINKKRQ